MLGEYRVWSCCLCRPMETDKLQEQRLAFTKTNLPLSLYTYYLPKLHLISVAEYDFAL